ncbi:MAG TPA: surface-adhesin E family protein [Methylibium sp.]|nr:surface-adhesin E family protein [Methylibium sp.]
MKQYLSTLALLLVAAPAAAEWTELGGNDTVTFYADTATLATAGGIASMWTLVSSKTPRSNGEVKFSSIRTRFEFDCAGQRIRELESRFHAGEMGEGAVVGGHAEAGAWEPLAEGSVKHEVAQLACKKG